jgi:serine/threonine protein kinase
MTSATSRPSPILLPHPGRSALALRRTQEAVDSHDTLTAPVRAPGKRPGNGIARTRVEGVRVPRDGRRPGASVLGRYELLDRLGAGGFGVVWRAHDTLLDREVAVKVIPLPAGEDRERATREALAAARLAHPAIVALYEACAEDDAFYLISELVHGETLAELIAAEALSDEEVLEIGLALADALQHAHERGVIHRDIKPHNVLVPAAGAHRDGSPSPNGQPRSASPAKLTDFGGALLAGEDALTRTGDVLGTLAYMAPEQIEGHEVDGQADLYSLALVLYEALSGVNPVRGPTPAATARRIGSELPPLARQRRDLPRELACALDLALDPDPAARGTLSELRAELAHALHGGLRRGARPRRASASSPAAQPQLLRVPLAAAAEPPPARSPERSLEDREESEAERGWLTLPRLGWLVGALAACVWQLAVGRAGAALVVLCAAAPVVLLVRRPGPGWLAAALAPVLGLLGLAAAFPALAGQADRWRTRALLGALGYWWLRLGEPLLESPSNAATTRWLAPLPSLGLLLGLALWGFAAALLPWVVRGRHALLDAAAAALWATALAAAALAAGPLLHRDLSISQASSRDVLLGAALGGLLAVAARALRGPVRPV